MAMGDNETYSQRLGPLILCQGQTIFALES